MTHTVLYIAAQYIHVHVQEEEEEEEEEEEGEGEGEEEEEEEEGGGGGGGGGGLYTCTFLPLSPPGWCRTGVGAQARAWLLSVSREIKCARL